MPFSRQLKKVGESHIKDIDKLEIKFDDFDRQIFNENFIIEGTRILYPYDSKQQQYQDGIMEREDLVEQERKF